MRIPAVATVLVGVLAALASCGDDLSVDVEIIVYDSRDPTEVRWEAPDRSEALREGDRDVFVLEEVFAAEEFVPNQMTFVSFRGRNRLDSFDVVPLINCVAHGDESGALISVRLSVIVYLDGSAFAHRGRCQFENDQNSWIAGELDYPRPARIASTMSF